MRKYVLIFLLSVVLYFVRACVSGHAIYGDANAYWSHAHAIYFKGSLDYSEIYDYLSKFQGKKYVFSRVFWITTPYVGEQLRNPWLVGPALLWLPLMGVFGAILSVSRIFLSPFELVWEVVPGISGIFYGIYGLRLNEKTLSRFFSKRTSSLTVILLYLSSNLFYYISLEPAHSHSAIYFLNSFFVFYIISLDFDKKISWFKLAFIGGLSSFNNFDRHANKEIFKIYI
jgi:hypothetical protein